MVIRCDKAFFQAMQAAGYDIDRKRLLEIYAQARALRQGCKSEVTRLEEVGQERLIFDDLLPAA